MKKFTVFVRGGDWEMGGGGAVESWTFEQSGQEFQILVILW